MASGTLTGPQIRRLTQLGLPPSRVHLHSRQRRQTLPATFREHAHCSFRDSKLRNATASQTNHKLGKNADRWLTILVGVDEDFGSELIQDLGTTRRAKHCLTPGHGRLQSRIPPPSTISSKFSSATNIMVRDSTASVNVC